MWDKLCWSSYSAELLHIYIHTRTEIFIYTVITPTACYLHYLPLSTVKLLSVVPVAYHNHRWLFWMKTCPEPPIKNRLWHHRGKSCWHSYHVACVDAASEGLSSPTWLIIWQDQACRRVPSTLIKSVPLLNTSAMLAMPAAAATQSDGQLADMPGKYCAQNAIIWNKTIRGKEIDYLYSTMLQTIIFPCRVQHQVSGVLWVRKKVKQAQSRQEWRNNRR